MNENGGGIVNIIADKYFKDELNFSLFRPPTSPPPLPPCGGTISVVQI
jgi:hypothetical protein